MNTEQVIARLQEIALPWAVAVEQVKRFNRHSLSDDFDAFVAANDRFIADLSELQAELSLKPDPMEDAA